MARTQVGYRPAVFSSHNIDRLYPHEVPLAFKAFMRVLQPKGFAVITCPDLHSAAEMIVKRSLLKKPAVAGHAETAN